MLWPRATSLALLSALPCLTHCLLWSSAFSQAHPTTFPSTANQTAITAPEINQAWRKGLVFFSDNSVPSLNSQCQRQNLISRLSPLVLEPVDWAGGERNPRQLEWGGPPPAGCFSLTVASFQSSTAIYGFVLFLILHL